MILTAAVIKAHARIQSSAFSPCPRERGAGGPLPASPVMEEHITGEAYEFSPCRTLLLLVRRGELEGGRCQRHTNRLDHGLNIRQHLIIRKAQHAVMMLFT